MKSNLITFISIFLIFCAVSLSVDAAVVISISEKVSVNSSLINLGDIADITGVSGKQLEKIKSISLGKALLPGYERVIPKTQIKLLIENAGFSFEQFDSDIPKMVYVRTASRVLKEEEIFEKAKEYLLGNLDYEGEKIDINLRFLPPDIVLPDKEFELKFELPQGISKFGNLSLRALVIIDNVIYKRLFLGFEVKIEKEVYIAKRPISPGEKVYKDDFYREVKMLTSFRGNLINDFSNRLIKDGIVKIEIPKEEVLTTYYLALPNIVYAGDELQAEIIIGSVSITTKVKARQSGKKGQYITVENSNTGHRFKAEVVSSYKVRLVQ